MTAAATRPTRHPDQAKRRLSPSTFTALAAACSLWLPASSQAAPPVPVQTAPTAAARVDCPDTATLAQRLVCERLVRGESANGHLPKSRPVRPVPKAAAPVAANGPATEAAPPLATLPTPLNDTAAAASADRPAPGTAPPPNPAPASAPASSPRPVPRPGPGPDHPGMPQPAPPEPRPSGPLPR